jgi:hypothetical protein
MPNTKTNQPTTFLERDEWLRAVIASDLPHVAVRVAVAIGLKLHVKTGRCDPGIDDIITASNVPERSIYRQIALLERAGWIAVQRVRGFGRRNEYVLVYPDKAVAGYNPDRAVAGLDPTYPASGDTSTLPKTAIYPANRWQDKEESDKRRKRERKKDIYPAPDFASPFSKGDATPKPDRENRGNGENVTTVSASDPDQVGDDENVTSLKPGDLDSAFAEFWAICPKKVGPIATRRELAAAIRRGVAPAKINAAMARYAVEVKGLEPRRIKNPANWLRDGYYDNEPTAGAVTIDEHGNVIDAPRPSRPQTTEEFEQEILAENAHWSPRR